MLWSASVPAARRGARPCPLPDRGCQEDPTPHRARSRWLVTAALLLALLLAVAMRREAPRPDAGCERHDRRGRRRERVRQRDHPDRRQVRERHSGREQPEHRSAHLRGQPERGPGGQRAQLVVQNGVGYDTFMNKIEAASPNSTRKVINVQQLLGLPDSTPNPHLWYNPTTMPAVAKAMAADLSALQPAHAAYFQANAAEFDASLQPWLTGHRQLQGRLPEHAGGDDRAGRPTTCSQAAGIDNLTPFSFQADIMNGVDPSPQDVSLRRACSREHKVKVFVLQPAGHRLAHRSRSSHGATRQRDPGGRRLRDDADAGLRLPVLDAGRGQRAREGGGRTASRPSKL